LHTGQDEGTEETLKRLIRARAEPRHIDLLTDESVPVDAALVAGDAGRGALGFVRA
jgi:hypothetical protein